MKIQILMLSGLLIGTAYAITTTPIIPRIYVPRITTPKPVVTRSISRPTPIIQQQKETSAPVIPLWYWYFAAINGIDENKEDV